MQIIAKTENGYIVSASIGEIEEIFSCVSRPITRDNPIKIGDKIPAYDYSSVVKQCKAYKNSSEFNRFKDAIEKGSALVAKIDSMGCE